MRSSLRLRMAVIVSAIGVMTCGTLARAASISMSQTLFPAPGEMDPVGGDIVDVLTVPVIAPTFTGSLTTTVIDNDLSNPFGGLTFTYLLSNDVTSQHAIGRFTVNGFAGFLTDTSYQTPTTDRPPTLINRSAASVIGFNYIDDIGPGTLMPGMTTALMVIQTDAPDYIPSIASVIDGTVATVPTFAPIPEPGTAALFVAGALTLLRRRAAR